MSKAEEITGENFDEKVLKSHKKVLVDFFAPWCGPCQMMGQVIDEISEEIKDKSFIYKVNIDEQADLASKYNVMSIPTILIFENGKIIDQQTGGASKDSLMKKLA